MKKLMIGLVGACAFGVMADVASENIVGYVAKGIENVQFIGNSFLNCGGDDGDITIGKLQTNCDMTGEVGDGWQPLADAIVMLNENGSFVRNLVFLPKYIADEIEAEEGWYDSNLASDDDFSKKYDDTEITFGYGIQVATDAGAEVTFAGAVKSTPTIIDVEGCMIVANCAPKPLKLGDLITNCDLTGEVGDGWQPLADAIVMLNENGSFVRNLVFLPKYIADEIEAEEGWYDSNLASDDDFSKKWDNELEWQPGEAFQVSADAGAAVSINSAM